MRDISPDPRGARASAHDDFDPDTDTIRHDEQVATAKLAVYALMMGQQPPTDTPLRRDVARLAEAAFRRQQIADMRSRAQR